MGKTYRKRKSREKAYERIFYAMLALGAVLLVVLVVMSILPAEEGYVITEDGHVHDAAGGHIGTVDEMLADGSLVVTEDGHIHDAAGNHVAEITNMTAGSDGVAEQIDESASTEEPAQTEEPASEAE